jgi:hypothetical protein
VKLSYMSAARVIFEASRQNRNRLLSDPGLAIDATPEDFKTTNAFAYSIDGTVRVDAAATGISFSAAHVVTASKFGVIAVEIDDEGAISTRVNEATQTTAMAYDSAALAWAARLTSPSAADKLIIGYIKIANNAGDWTANTDDLTDGSDLTTATFERFDDELQTDFSNSWEELTPALRDARAMEVRAYLESGSVPSTVATYVDPILFQAIVTALRN